MKDKVIFKKDNPDIKEMCDFLNPSFKNPVVDATYTPDFWKWKHFDNPDGKSLMFVAKHNNKIVGARPLWKNTLSYKGKDFDALQCVDSAVHPAMRGRRIFSNLNKYAMDNVKNVVVFNSPNENSVRAFVRGGWANIRGFNTYFRPLRLSALFKYLTNYILSKRRLTRKLKIPKIENAKGISKEPPKKIKEVLRVNNETLKDFVTIKIDEKWLNWRIKNPTNAPYYFFQPFKDQNFVIIFYLRNNSGLRTIHVLDILADYRNDRLISKGIGCFLKFAKRYVEGISLSVTDNHPLTKTILKKRFVKMRIKNLTVKLEKLKSKLAKDFLNPDKWAVMISVFDGG